MINLRQQIQFIESSLCAMGLSLRPSSRWDYYKIQIQRSYIPEGDPEFKKNLEMLIDVPILHFILSVLKDKVEPQILKEKVRQIISGVVLPEDEKTETPGRDIQAELYMAAICMKAGLTPVLLEEPDIVFNYLNQPFGIAVKSFDKIDRHFKKAVEQISNRGIIGIVVLDIRRAVNPKNQPIWASDYATEQAFKKARRILMDLKYQRFKEIQKGRNIRGIIFVDHILRNNNGRWEANGFHYFATLDLHNQAREKEFELICKEIEKGMPNLQMRAF